MTEEDNPTMVKFDKQLEQIRKSLELMETYGIDKEILVTWLQVKTKLSKKDINMMLRSTEEFYNKLLKKEMLNIFESEDKQEKINHITLSSLKLCNYPIKNDKTAQKEQTE